MGKLIVVNFKNKYRELTKEELIEIKKENEIIIKKILENLGEIE